MGSRATPPPTSKPPQTGEVDETWDDVLGSLVEPPKEPESGDDIFDRATAIPTPAPPRKLSELKLELDSKEPGPIDPRKTRPYKGPPAPSDLFGSDPPPDSDGRPAVLPGEAHGAFSAQTAPAVPRGKEAPPSAPDRARTVPEPAVERFLSRVEQGRPSTAELLQQRRRASGSLELDMSQERASPLDLVENYRRGVDSVPGSGPSPSSPSPGPTTDRPSGTFSDMQDRYAVGDFTGALVVAESILDANPEDEDAKRYAQSCREVLTQMYAARIGPMEQIAVIAVPPEQITWLSLDHRAGFLLSLVDGVSSIEEILDISGMSRLDALRIMYTLVQQNVVTLS